MRCPSCRLDVADRDASHCPGCGARLPAPEARTTDPLPAAAPTGDGDSVRPPGSEPSGGRRRSHPRRRASRPGRAGPLAALTRSPAARRWLDEARAASAAFMVALCAGAVLVVAAKLQDPSLGAGSDPASVLTVIVMVALGTLGAALRLDDLAVSALPLGAAATVGAALVWSSSAVVARRLAARGTRGADVSKPVRRALAGARIGAPFALLTWAAALIFRLRSGPTPVSVGAGEALLLGALWGAACGALGGLRAPDGFGTALAPARRALDRRAGPLIRGLGAGGAMLVVAGVGAAGAALLWIVAVLVRGVPPAFGIPEAAAAAIFLVAFAPNVVVSLLALSLGAPVEVGAKLRIGGRVLGPVQELSLTDWGGGPTPWYLWLLVLIPLCACLLGGFAARRKLSGRPAMAETLGVAAVTFAALVGALAAVADARLGAGLVRPRGFAHVAPHAFSTFLLALAWAGVLGVAGWKSAESYEASLPGGRDGAEP
ncbi:MAG: hypothetical protein ABR529_09605 [Actinomycetota bacterium]